MLKALCTETLSKVRDGLLGEMLDSAILDAKKNCADRPRLKKKRSITLKIDITPTGEETLEACDVDFEVKTSFPGQKFGRQMKAGPRVQTFGFETDTDNIDHDASQKAFHEDDD